MTVAELLIEIRASLRLSQKELSEKLEINHSQLAGYEIGHRRPHRPTIMRMVKFAVKEAGMDVKYSDIE